MQGIISESTDHADELTKSRQTIELLKFELAQEQECYSSYYLDLFFNSGKKCMDGATQLKAVSAEVLMLKHKLSQIEIDKAKLVEKNASLWKIIFALLKGGNKK